MSAPARVDLVNEHAAAHGTALVVDIALQNADGSAATLTGRDFVFRLWTAPTAAEPTLTGDIGDGRLAVLGDEDDGVLRLEIAQEDIAALEPKRWVYGINEVSDDQEVGLIAGLLEVLRHGEGRRYPTGAPAITVRTQTSVILVSHGALIAGGTTSHADLSGRNAANAHPISAITDLAEQLATLASEIATHDTTLGTLTSSLATLTASLATHVANAAAHLPAGVALNRSIRGLSGTTLDWSGRAIRHGAPAGDGDWSAGTLDLRDNPVSDSNGQVALRVMFTHGSTGRAIALGGATNGVGMIPIAAMIPVPAPGESADQYRVSGLLTVAGLGATGLAHDCVIYPRTQIWASASSVLILGWSYVSNANGGAGWYRLGPMTSEFSGSATDGSVGLGFDALTREIKILWPDGSRTKHAPTSTY